MQLDPFFDLNESLCFTVYFSENVIEFEKLFVILQALKLEISIFTTVQYGLFTWVGTTLRNDISVDCITGSFLRRAIYI